MIEEGWKKGVEGKYAMKLYLTSINYF